MDTLTDPDKTHSLYPQIRDKVKEITFQTVQDINKKSITKVFNVKRSLKNYTRHKSLNTHIAVTITKE